ncbi:MAG: ParB/RepB/Spo0J family partition protein [Nanoarchaeota archaeon]
MEVKDIELSKIKVSDYNTRKDLDSGTEDSSLNDLANSIKEKGLLNPIMIMKQDDGTYEVVAGQRRYLACKRLGWNKISAIIRDKMDDADATVLSLIENVHRADMGPIDKAKAYQKIYEKYKDYNTVAKETGMSTSTIKKYVLLLNLASSIQDKLTTNDGPAGIGALSKLAETFSSPEEQERVLEDVGGFKQSIQLEMIKRSGGDLDKLTDLKEQALDGAFDTHVCHGLDDCSFIPIELKAPLKEAIDKFKKGEKEISFKDLVKTLK